MKAFSGFTHALQRHTRGCFGNTPTRTRHVTALSHILYNLATAFLVPAFLSSFTKGLTQPYCETSSYMSTLGAVDWVLLKAQHGCHML